MFAVLILAQCLLLFLLVLFFPNCVRVVVCAFCVIPFFQKSLIPTFLLLLCSCRYAAIRSNGEVRGEFDDCSENAIHNFFDSLKELEGSIQEDLADIKPIRMTAELELEFQNAVNCWICDEVLGEDRVHDHDHLTGKYYNFFVYFCCFVVHVFCSCV